MFNFIFEKNLMIKSSFFITFLLILISVKSFAEIVLFVNGNSVTSLRFIGQVQVTDGDTIRNGKLKIRLHGIDAPEFNQLCKKPYLTVFIFTFTKDYQCGKISTEKLKKKINDKLIKCKILDIDRYKRLIGECYKRNLNLNSWLVSNGYAVAYKKYSKKYISDEINAKNKKIGIWQGKFEMPWDYRRKLNN